MDPEKRKRLEAVGWQIGDAADFLGLTEVESRIVEVRPALARAGREPTGKPEGGRDDASQVAGPYFYSAGLRR